MDLFDILSAVTPVVAIAIFFMVAHTNSKWLNKANFELARGWATIGITLAETIYGAKTGKTKKDYVAGLLQAFNIDLTVEQVSILIDGLCLELTEKGVINKNG